MIKHDMTVDNNEILMENLQKLSREENKKERRRILKNILLISFGFLLNFTAFMVGEY